MNILIIIISVLTIAASFYLFRKATGSMALSKLHTVSYVFYFQIITSAIIASVLLAIGALDYHEHVRDLPAEIKIEAWLWTMYSIVAMPIGMLVMNKVINVNGRELFETYLKRPVEIVGTPLQNKAVLLGVTMFSLLVLAYIFYYTDRIALWTLVVEGNPEQASIDRVNARLNFGGIIHIKNLAGLIMMPAFCYYSYVIMRKKKSLFYVMIFGVNFVLSLLLVAHDTQKAPIAFFFMGFWILEVFIVGGINTRKLMLFVAAPILLLLLGYAFTTGSGFDQLLRFNSAFYGRTFLTNYYALPLSLELFPDVITEPTHFIGLPKGVLSSMGTNTIESARLLKMYMDPETVKAGSGNLYSGYYMAEAWANYGYIGLVIAPFIVGFVIHSVHLFLLTQPKQPLILAFYTALTVKWVVASGFVNFLYLKLLFWPLALYLITNFVLKKYLQPAT